jgi:hypothetical protein
MGCLSLGGIRGKNRSNQGGLPLPNNIGDPQQGQPRGVCTYQTILATHNQGNHGGIAPTKIGSQPGQPRGVCTYPNWFTTRATTGGLHLPKLVWRPTTGTTTGGLYLPKLVLLLGKGIGVRASMVMVRSALLWMCCC